jgi:hypothetical protein
MSSGGEQGLLDTGVENFQHFFSDVMASRAVNHLLKNNVVFFTFRHLLDGAIGCIQHFLQLFVATAIEVFLKFALFALKVAVLLPKFFLTSRAYLARIFHLWT